MEKLEAQMSFSYSKSNHLVHVTLDCPQQSINELTEIIQQKVASSVCEEDRFLMMYDFALENKEHSCFEKKAVYVGEPPSFVRKQWIAILDLPMKGKAGLRLAGHQGSWIKATMVSTKCAISIVTHEETDNPHVSIRGDYSATVNECRKIVKKRLEKCR